MMFFYISICLKYYFQEFGLKINPYTLKVTLNHKHNTIKRIYQSQFHENEVLHNFCTLCGKNHIFYYLTFRLTF